MPGHFISPRLRLWPQEVMPEHLRIHVIFPTIKSHNYAHEPWGVVARFNKVPLCHNPKRVTHVCSPSLLLLYGGHLFSKPKAKDGQGTIRPFRSLSIPFDPGRLVDSIDLDPQSTRWSFVRSRKWKRKRPNFLFLNPRMRKEMKGLNNPTCQLLSLRTKQV